MKIEKQTNKSGGKKTQRKLVKKQRQQKKNRKKMKRKTDENQSEHSHRATERAKISRPKYCSTEEKAFCERNIRLAISKI